MTEPIERVATCHTQDCGNADVAITVLLEHEEQTVICGPCGQPITDITPVAEAESPAPR